jgi:hypothetical protein
MEREFSAFAGVPGLTRRADVKLNYGVSLRPPGAEILAMTQERRSHIVFTATLAVVAAAWLFFLFAFADVIFRH